MATTPVFKTGKLYNFSVWPDQVLGVNFNNIMVVGVVNYELATRYADIDVLHASVIPYIPEGLPSRPQDYEYLIYKTQAQQGTYVTSIIGIPWIKADTIVLVDGIDFNVMIRGESMDAVERIRLMLAQNGIRNYNIEILNRDRVIQPPKKEETDPLARAMGTVEPVNG